MSYLRKLERALSYAPVELLVKAGGMVTEKGITYSNRNDHTHRLTDCDLVRVNAGRRTPLNAVSVRSTESFRELLEAAVDLAEVDPYDVEDTKRHEDRHAEVLRALGLPCVFEVVMLKVAADEEALRAGRIQKAFQPHMVPGQMVVPKIIMGAMNMRPEDPSEGDLAAAVSYGYQGAQDVGNRIIQYVDSPGAMRPILMPLTYVSGSSA